MQNAFISLKDALAELDSGRKCDIVFITYDHRRQAGGERIEAKQVHKHNWLSTADVKKQSRLQPTKQILKKDPRHYENSTRNIVMAGGQVRKVHIRLIRQLNGATVL